MTEKPISCWQRNVSDISIQALTWMCCKTTNSTGTLTGRSSGTTREGVVQYGDQFFAQIIEAPDKQKNIHGIFPCFSSLGSEMRCRYSQGCFLPPIQQLFQGTNGTHLPSLPPTFEPLMQTKPTLYSVKHFMEVFVSFSSFMTAVYFFDKTPIFTFSS